VRFTDPSKKIDSCVKKMMVAGPACHMIGSQRSAQGCTDLQSMLLTEHERPDAFPEHTYYSACRPVCDGKGCHSGGVGVFMSSRVKQRVEFVKAAADASYL